MASALEFQQYPVATQDQVPVITNWNPVIGYMVFQDDATTASYYYYKIILEVRLDDATGTLIGKIKQRRNGYSVDVNDNKARAFFDLRDIVNSQLVDTVFDQNQTGAPFDTIHKLGGNTGVTAKIFSINGDRNTDRTQIQTIYVKAYQQYSEAADEIPQEITTDTINNTRYWMAASLPLLTPRFETGTGLNALYIQGEAFEKYQCNNQNDLFLSDVEKDLGVSEYGLSNEYVNYVQSDDYHTLGFLNDNANFESEINYIWVTYYNSAGVVLGNVSIQNHATNGGWIPDDSEGTADDKYRLLYVGVGPGNLESSAVVATDSDDTASGNAKPSNYPTWAYYKVNGRTGAVGTGNTLKTSDYYFIKQDGSCKGFKIRRLGWRNSLGCYDYFNFKMKSSQTVEVSRDNYASMLGTFNASKFRYNNTQRGKKTRQTTAILKETLNTDWITETQANLIEKLIMSTDVYVIKNSDTTYTEPIMITDKSFVRKTSANDKLIQYTINIEYANPINTNS